MYLLCSLLLYLCCGHLIPLNCNHLRLNSHFIKRPLTIGLDRLQKRSMCWFSTRYAIMRLYIILRICMYAEKMITRKKFKGRYLYL